MGSNSRRRGTLVALGTLVCLILVNAGRYGPAPPPVYSLSNFRTRQVGSHQLPASTGFRSLSTPSLRTVFQCIGSGEFLGGATEDDLKSPGVYLARIMCPFDGSNHTASHHQRAQRRSPRQKQRMERLGIRSPYPPLKVYTKEKPAFATTDKDGIVRTTPSYTQVTLEGCGTATHHMFNPTTGVYDTYTYNRPCPTNKNEND